MKNKVVNFNSKQKSVDLEVIVSFWNHFGEIVKGPEYLCLLPNISYCLKEKRQFGT